MLCICCGASGTFDTYKSFSFANLKKNTHLGKNLLVCTQKMDLRKNFISKFCLHHKLYNLDRA